ncbi:SdpI family protein [Actinomyces johnsonii]|uniref:SdpI family protein n=1 Tax=Actinomyces johnsonii TaxID=544581 RepID=A0A508ADA7_9ACTO|nr:SdpI family protein [Actinomyces johnsonii]KAA8741020.1 SdpI family protein [Actinomyces johnsonii]TQD45045.1 SdpI family protein [Actinomyces johnsonii]
MVETAFSVLMSLILGVTGVGLVVLGRRMSQRRLPPNSWAGVRYEIAQRSEKNWYEMQAQCAVAAIGLGVVFIDSALLFVIQAVLHETVSILIPMAITLIQTAAGMAILHVQARRCRALLLKNTLKSSR